MYRERLLSITHKTCRCVPLVFAAVWIVYSDYTFDGKGSVVVSCVCILCAIFLCMTAIAVLLSSDQAENLF